MLQTWSRLTVSLYWSFLNDTIFQCSSREVSYIQIQSVIFKCDLVKQEISYIQIQSIVFKCEIPGVPLTQPAFSVGHRRSELPPPSLSAVHGAATYSLSVTAAPRVLCPSMEATASCLTSSCKFTWSFSMPRSGDDQEAPILALAGTSPSSDYCF
ncbi:uncharacterized protein LOC120524071 isoform X5 [Polypterus senegalus]|uniref:uncharacterized protein LOC120524071 isoform X5 n=1 Tax=Polypterus senegalus TaxID=55291 RepID=UPI00196423E1|nr:uncharacterized protein LOC120524071 isoform X5 [Polypterus senegalus]